MLSTPATTSERILEAAADLIQSRGYNGFSYLDIAKRVGIRKASVHHHFPTKGDLGQAVVRHFMARYTKVMKSIEADHDPGLDRIMAFADIAGGMLDQRHVCPCAMLATEIASLPEPMREELHRYYGLATAWLARCIRRGKTDGGILSATDAEDAAQMVLSTIQGASIAAHCVGSRARFDAAMRHLRLSLAARIPQ